MNSKKITEKGLKLSSIGAGTFMLGMIPELTNISYQFPDSLNLMQQIGIALTAIGVIPTTYYGTKLMLEDILDAKSEWLENTRQSSKLKQISVRTKKIFYNKVYYGTTLQEFENNIIIENKNILVKEKNKIYLDKNILDAFYHCYEKKSPLIIMEGYKKDKLVSTEGKFYPHKIYLIEKIRPLRQMVGSITDSHTGTESEYLRKDYYKKYTINEFLKTQEFSRR